PVPRGRAPLLRPQAPRLDSKPPPKRPRLLQEEATELDPQKTPRCPRTGFPSRRPPKGRARREQRRPSEGTRPEVRWACLRPRGVIFDPAIDHADHTTGARHDAGIVRRENKRRL